MTSTPTIDDNSGQLRAVLQREFELFGQTTGDSNSRECKH